MMTKEISYFKSKCSSIRTLLHRSYLSTRRTQPAGGRARWTTHRNWTSDRTSPVTLTWADQISWCQTMAISQDTTAWQSLRTTSTVLSLKKEGRRCQLGTGRSTCRVTLDLLLVWLLSRGTSNCTPQSMKSSLMLAARKHWTILRMMALKIAHCRLWAEVDLLKCHFQIRFFLSWSMKMTWWCQATSKKKSTKLKWENTPQTSTWTIQSSVSQSQCPS